MKAKLIIVFLWVSIGAWSQQYQLFGVATANSIQLKWMSKSTAANASFDLYRKGNNGSWEKINEKPIVAAPVIKAADLKSNKNPFPNDDKYATYIEYKNNKEASPNKQAYANYSLAIASIFDNDLARYMGIYYEDMKISPNQKYQYKLVDSATQKELSVTTALQLGDKITAPTELKGTQEKQNVELTWNVNERFIGYNIYKNGSKLNDEPILPNAEKNQTYVAKLIDEKVMPGTTAYAVSGLTFLNTESEISPVIRVDVKDLTAPIGITNFKVSREEKEIKLQWKASNDKEAKGYFIYRSTDKGKTYQKLNATILDLKKGAFSDPIQTSGAVQYYVGTVDEAGNERPSIPVSVFVPDHQAPEMPRTLASKTERGKVTLSWQPNTEKDLLGYRIYRGLKDDDENGMLLLNVKPQVATTFIDTFPRKANTKLRYKVAAIDQSFNESRKAVLWVQLPDIVPPAAPVLKSALLNQGRVVLQWEQIKNDAVLGYDVYRIVEDKKSKLNESKIVTGNFSDTNLPKHGICEYYVQAIDSARLESVPSNRLVVSIERNMQKSDIKLSASQDLRSKKVALTVSGIVPDEVQQVQLFRKAGSAGFKIIPFGFTQESFIDDTSEPGKIYEYYLELIDWSNQRTRTETISFNNPLP